MSTTTSPVPAPALAQNPQARRLAWVGLAPFVLGTVLAWLVGERSAEAHAFVMLALATYAAGVITFLAGLCWGLAFRSGAAVHLGWSLFPPLLAWVAALMPAYAGLVIHGVLLIAGYLIDRRLYPAFGAADWLTLRFRLGAIAAFCCFLAAAGS